MGFGWWIVSCRSFLIGTGADGGSVIVGRLFCVSPGYRSGRMIGSFDLGDGDGRLS